MKSFRTFDKKEITRKNDSFSVGRYPIGSRYQLTHEIKGTGYKVGDIFQHISEADCKTKNPYTLKIGSGMGEYFFVDSSGKGVQVHSDQSVIDTIFEFVESPKQNTIILEELDEVEPTVTYEQFSDFKEELSKRLSETTMQEGPMGLPGRIGFRGGQGSDGLSGKDGAKGDKGESGIDGLNGDKGESGLKGDSGPDGSVGKDGSDGKDGPAGSKGDKGIDGADGADGIDGLKGDKGIDGADGIDGLKGDKGIIGKDGAKGDKGIPGKDGSKGDKGIPGKDGSKGDKGIAGEDGVDGKEGKDGDSGLLEAKFPLVYDKEEKTISIDEDRLDKILKNILGGGSVSPRDMGWLTSSGGGKVAVYRDGVKITPDVRGIDFTGSGVTSITKVGGRVTVTTTDGAEAVAGNYLSSSGNVINLDLKTGLTTDVVVSTVKHDFLPILKNHATWLTQGFSGPTKLISVPALLNSSFPQIGVVDEASQPLVFGIGTGLEQSLLFKIIGVNSGKGANILQIDARNSAKPLITLGANTTVDDDLGITGNLTITGSLSVAILGGGSYI